MREKMGFAFYVFKETLNNMLQVKARLEQLDDFEEGSVQEQMDLSQADFIKRIEDLNQVGT